MKIPTEFTRTGEQCQSIMSHMSDDVSKAVASENHNGRTSAGSNPPISTYGPSAGGMLVPKHNTAGGPDIGAGTAAVKPHSDRMGASYRIKQTFPAQVPQAQATQANGRIIPPTHRVGKGFWAQAADL